MHPDSERFVAHLDILGMSALLEADPELAWEVLSELVGVRDDAHSQSVEFLETKETVELRDAIRMVTFSDTILLFTKGNSDVELRCMLILLSEIFYKSLFGCVPIRVGLALGTLFVNFDKSMYAGPALVDAYRTGESAQWLGITLSESVRERAIELELGTKDRRVLVDWELPLKDASKRHTVVNWPAIFVEDLTVSVPISLATFYEGFQPKFGPYEALPQSVRCKYESTVKFLNEQLAPRSEA